jgi:tight adherence protein C
MPPVAPIESILSTQGVFIAVMLGISVLLLVVSGTFAFGYRPDPSLEHQRLKNLKGQHLFQSATSALTRPGEGPMTSLARKVFLKDVKLIDKTKQVLIEAGIRQVDDAVWQHLTKKVTMALGLGLMGMMVASVFASGQILYMAMGLIGGLLLGNRLPDLQLKQRIKARKDNIRFSLSDVLDLLVVCLEAGLSVDSAFLRLISEGQEIAPDFTEELQRSVLELQSGLSRQEVFRNLGKRCGVDEVASLCSLIIQSDKLGTSIAEAVRIYADTLRTKIRQHAEEQAAKAPVKMVFPLVLFILPSLLIVLLGPVMILILGAFGSKLP